MAIVLMILGNIPENLGGGTSAFAATTPFSQEELGSSNVPMVVSEVEDRTFIQYQNWPSEFTMGPSSFVGGAFDGTNIRFTSHSGSRVIKLDTRNGEMANAFQGGTLDGTNIWFNSVIISD